MAYDKEQRPLDLRVKRTYSLLCQAFARLLETQRYEDVSISALCDEAMIRRTTFYKHFADKSEFFAFYVRTLRDEFQQSSAPPDGLESTKENTMRMTRELISFLQSNTAFVNGVVSSNMFPVLLDIFSEQIERDILISFKREGKALSGVSEYLASFYAGGILQAIRHWWPQHEDDAQEKTLLSSIATALGE